MLVMSASDRPDPRRTELFRSAAQVFMKITLAILTLIVFALSFVADYKWRKWMASRRDEQRNPEHRDGM